ncbi:MAG: hypothetical protein BalsKO_32300 [Balneolaceae bacterium]
MVRFLVLLTSLGLVGLDGFSQSLLKPLSQSDSLTTKFWSVEDGLPINTINQVTQDDDGYLWLTTYDGIVRFDGLEFKTFNHSNTPEIPHNRATEIHKQDGVGIWVSMEHEGVLLITEDGFQHFGQKEGFSKSDVTQIYEDLEGRMFFVTHDGLFVYENEQFNQFFHGKDEQQDRTRFIFEDGDGSKWIATNNGLIHKKENEVIEYNVSEIQKENQFFTVFRDSDGVLLAGSTSGLFILENGKLISPQKLDVLKDSDVYRIFEFRGATFFSSYKGTFIFKDGSLRKLEDPYRKENEAYYSHLVDSEGLLWLIGDRGTLSVFKNQRISDLKAITDTGLTYFISVFEDREKNIWVTTPREGIIRLKKAQVKTIGKAEGLSEDNILGLLKDSKDRYWVGTRGGGLNLIEENKVRHYIEHRDISSSVVQSIAEDSLGNIWIGHYQKGLNRISGEEISEFKLGDRFDINNIHALYTAKNGQLWVGTYGGLVKFDAKNFQHTTYTKENGLEGVKIRYVTEAQDGSLWLGTLDGGVSHFKNGTFKNYTKEDGLSSNNVRSIYIDKSNEDVVWIGTENNGLNRIKEDKISYIGTEDGLPNYNIHWISEDNDGWLWMSSNNGIFKILKSSLNSYLDGESSSFTMLVFGENEGMRNSEGNGSIQEAGIREENDIFWFATQEGVAIFEKESLLNNGFIPKVIIKSVSAKGQTFSSDSIFFDPYIDDFEVEMHAITHVKPEKTMFRYRMHENNEIVEDWVEIGNERFVQFTDVSPGEYRLEAQASNQAGEWIEETASLYFVMHPKYYEQAWFYILCVVGFSLLLIGGWQLRYRRLVADQQKMEKIIEKQVELIRQEKTEIELQKEIIEKQAEILEQSNKTKDKFFSIIGHDLKNPFQSMLGYTEYLYSDLEKFSKSEIKEGLETIRNSSQTLLNLTVNLLEWANLQTEKVKPKPVEFVLHDLVQGNERLFSQSAYQKEIKLLVESDAGIILFADYNMINTVFRNLISNAIKFTKNGGSVLIKTECIDRISKISITDTGIGMSNEILEGAMSLDLKTTREGTNKETGTGLGLVLCKDMVEMNNGKLSISSEEGKGTTFVVELPCK